MRRAKIVPIVLCVLFVLGNASTTHAIKGGEGEDDVCRQDLRPIQFNIACGVDSEAESHYSIWRHDQRDSSP